jgi:hypothetical protein
LNCLTSNRSPAAHLPGAFYSFFRPGLQIEKFPMRVPDSGGATGWIPFERGALTQSLPGRVEWDPCQLEPHGVELAFDLGEECVVERVILRHFATPTEFSFHDDPHMSLRGITRAELRCFSPTAGGPESTNLLSAERGSSLPEEILFQLDGHRAREVRIRLTGRQGIGLSSVEIWGDPVLAVYPTPQKMTLGEKPCLLTDRMAIFVFADGLEPARLLARRLEETTGLKLSVREARLPVACLMVGDSPDAPLPELSNQHPESHAILCDQQGARIRAVSSAGLFMAVGTIVRLAGKIAGGFGLRSIAIQDHPDTDLRGIHLFLPNRKNLPFFLRYLEYLSQGLKCNTIFLQLSPFMRFKSHPELEEPFRALIARARADLGRYNPHTLHDTAGGGEFVDQEDVLQMVAKAREVGLEVIPEIQTMSHGAWYLSAHPELAEDPDSLALMDHCPSNPATRVLVQELLEEAIALIKPKAVHIGHDEVRVIGKCPRCRGKSGAELFAEDVCWMHGFLKEKGIRTHMWSDHLIATHNGQFHGTHLAAPMLPKDVILHNWTPRSHLGPIDEQVNLGFEEILAGGYTTLFRDKPLQRKLKGKSYRKGYVLTTWAGADPISLGACGHGCLTNHVYAAESLWSAETPSFESPLFWARVESEVRRMRAGVILEPDPSGNAEPVQLPPGAPATDDRMPLNRLPSRVHSPSGWSFDINPSRCVVLEHPHACRARHPSASAAVPVGRSATGLGFLLAIRGDGVRNAGGVDAARFIVQMTGGREIEVPVIMNYHVGDMLRHGEGLRSDAHPLPGGDLAWLGDLGGRPGALYSMSWRNPVPGEVVESVRLTANSTGPEFVLGWLGLTVIAG